MLVEIGIKGLFEVVIFKEFLEFLVRNRGLIRLVVNREKCYVSTICRIQNGVSNHSCSFKVLSICARISALDWPSAFSASTSSYR